MPSVLSSILIILCQHLKMYKPRTKQRCISYSDYSFSKEGIQEEGPIMQKMPVLLCVALHREPEIGTKINMDF